MDRFARLSLRRKKGPIPDAVKKPEPEFDWDEVANAKKLVYNIKDATEENAIVLKAGSGSHSEVAGKTGAVNR